MQTANLAHLESSLSELQKEYCREIDRRVHAEEAKAEQEDRLFAALVRNDAGGVGAWWRYRVCANVLYVDVSK